MSEDVEHFAVAGHEVQLSHPAKVFFPGIGATKHDLAAYYLAIAEPFLRAAGDRPTMLQRFPDGAAGKSFFQKRVPPGAPQWLQTTTVSTPNGTDSNALVLADAAHVLWAVNLGCLGFHLWPFHVRDPEHADQLRIDLDPQPGVDFEAVRAAAGRVRELLVELGLRGYVKTSGSRGLHIYVPLAPRWSPVEVRAGAVALARELERRHPETITANWWKEERGQRVFVDFNQNAPHKTVFGAWSVRARKDAPVSTPIAWEELESVVPDELTIETVPGRVAAHGDPWAAMTDDLQSLEALLVLSAADRAAGLMDAPWPPEYPKGADEPTRVAPSRARKVAPPG